MERRRRTLLTVTGRAVSGLAVAALLTTTSLVSAQTSSPTAAPSAAKNGARCEKSPAAKAPPPRPPQLRRVKGSYAIGVSVGENLRRAKVSARTRSPSSASPQGVRDSLAGKVQMSQEYQSSHHDPDPGRPSVDGRAQPRGCRREIPRRQREARMDVITTASGLQYKVHRRRSNGARPKPTDQVSVNYHLAHCSTSTEFDASREARWPGEIPGEQRDPGLAAGSAAAG